MPVCAVRHCKNRSTGLKENNSKLYFFPHDPDLQNKWLEACGRQLEELKISTAAVCEIHFAPECIEKRATIPKTKCGQSRIMLRLKKGSLPTLNLDLQPQPKKMCLSSSRNTVHHAKSWCGAIPTYTQLVAYAKSKTACAGNEAGVGSAMEENSAVVNVQEPLREKVVEAR
ncbi:PREDICTED: uncharacterized protein LOC108777462 [Cyphomyrmex costatus]|uniref:THAP-type domain-containing protein n=1 Tax=Cyphomyrmex costatus TaxID=456900 RepID=A0A151IDK2_9HYME|nr:PREDICTED: uncharacterized protein LOC108777462 [Cyphomyrmex costatus]KYM98539.1 hypothetical protein ALC62_10737 [Cyphomyrmex costatus]